jgi:ligand-binding SRPBCC domain-containing protein
MHQIHVKQTLPITKEMAWEFLSDPKNLKVITPEYMGFNILSGAEKNAYPGQIIQYTVSPVLGIPLRWVTELTHVVTGSYFVDEQRFGPYSFWHHKHFIHSTENGVVMEDIVDYKLPMGILGKIFHWLYVKRKLKQIFNYRENKLKELFN